MEDTEANNTDAGKSTLEPLLHEQFLEARGRKERKSEHRTCVRLARNVGKDPGPAW